MHVVTEGDENDTEWVDNAYANNEQVELEDPCLDELQGDDWLDMTVVENITAKHNKSAPPTVTNNLKVGDIFEER